MSKFKMMWARLSDLWCEYMHDGALWPIHGAYQCRECFRVRVVPWNDDRTTVPSGILKQPVSIKTKRFVRDRHLSAA